MNESPSMTLYVWFWKLLAFVATNPWALAVLYVVLGICIWHFIKTTFWKGSVSEYSGIIYIKYTLMALVSLPLTLLGLILAPILPLLAEQRDGWLDNHSVYGRGPRLPLWLDWFMTPDNSLDGDATFEQINGRSYLAKVKWLLRNPCYAFGIKYLSVPYTATYIGDNTIKDNDNAKEGWCLVHANGIFQFTYVKRILSSSRCVYVNLGWNIRALVDDNYMPKPLLYQATFVFSPRISGYR